MRNAFRRFAPSGLLVSAVAALAATALSAQ